MLDAVLVKRSPIVLDQMTPVARLCAEYFVVAVPASSTFQSFGELRAALISNPGKVTWAGGPMGGIDHVGAALLAGAAGIDPAAINYVPFLTTPDAVTATAEER